MVNIMSTLHVRSTGVLMGQQHVWTAGPRQQSSYCPSAGQGALQEGAGQSKMAMLQLFLTGGRAAAAAGLCVAALWRPAGLGRVRRPEPLPPAGWRGLRAARPALLRSAAGAEGGSRSEVTQQSGELHCQAHRAALLLRGLCGSVPVGLMVQDSNMFVVQSLQTTEWVAIHLS